MKHKRFRQKADFVGCKKIDRQIIKEGSKEEDRQGFDVKKKYIYIKYQECIRRFKMM